MKVDGNQKRNHGQGQGCLVWDGDEHHGYGFEFDRRAEMDQEGEGDEELII